MLLLKQNGSAFFAGLHPDFISWLDKTNSLKKKEITNGSKQNCDFQYLAECPIINAITKEVNFLPHFYRTIEQYKNIFGKYSYEIIESKPNKNQIDSFKENYYNTVYWDGIAKEKSGLCFVINNV